MTLPVGENVVYCPGVKTSSKDSSIDTQTFNSKNLNLSKNHANKNSFTKTVEEKKFGIFEFRTKIVWFNAIGFLILHLAALYGLFLLFKEIFDGHFATLAWTVFLAISSGEGVTAGAHRLWTHRTYKATVPLQILLMTLQTLAGQNCCYIWVRDHRTHHKYSDTDADPHNASRGFFFSHIGWLMMKKHPDVISKGKGIDMSDLEANPIIMFQKKYYKSLYFLIALVIPVLTPVYFWNESLWKSFFICYFARYILVLNLTWCVNSVAHLFGTKPYDKNIWAVESHFVSFFGLGEGWHNYHHVFPWDYKASEFGMKSNLTTRLIEYFAKIGWAYDLQEASHNTMVKRIRRCGDGSHPVYSVENYSEEKDKLFTEAYTLKHLGKEFDTEEDFLKATENLGSKTENFLHEKINSINEETEVKCNETVRHRSQVIRHG